MRIIELFEGMSEDEAVELIKRDCKPFLSATSPHWLLMRGMKGRGGAFKQSVRTDRRPRNTKPELHDAIDKWFLEEFGVRARSQAVFVTGHSMIARSYGDLHAVFPIGDFRYIWSPVVDDLTVWTEDEHPDDIPKAMAGADYQDTDLEEAVHSQNEVMLVCKEYYAVPVGGEYDEIMELVRKLFPK